MTDSDIDRESALNLSNRVSARATHMAPDLSLVLVICSSRINRVVVTRIVERAGLRVIGETPQNAAEMLTRHGPGTVIFDCGASNDECRDLTPHLDARRRASGANLPRVIAIATTAAGAPAAFSTGVVDAVVSKPITPEGLQPIVERLIRGAVL